VTTTPEAPDVMWRRGAAGDVSASLVRKEPLLGGTTFRLLRRVVLEGATNCHLREGDPRVPEDYTHREPVRNLTQR
jgi:hypothetical protein